MVWTSDVEQPLAPVDEFASQTELTPFMKNTDAEHNAWNYLTISWNAYVIESESWANTRKKQ